MEIKYITYKIKRYSGAYSLSDIDSMTMTVIIWMNLNINKILSQKQTTTESKTDHSITYSCSSHTCMYKRRVETDTEEKKWLNKVILVFFSHKKKYSHSFITLWSNH